MKDRGLAGSLFAVAPQERRAAARALHREGIAVHADLIVGADGAHRGVTPDQVRAVRDDLPDARIDLHLIVELAPEDALGVVEEAVALGLEIAAERMSISPDLLRAHAPALQAARAQGLPLWCELAHGEEAHPIDGADGRLVMLIRPGSTDAADPAGLAAVRALAGRIPVGVDGGVTENLAHVCAELGAHPIVSGRALLTTR